MPCNRKQHMYAVLAFMTTGVLNCWQGERVMTANSEVHPGVDVDPYSGQSNGMLADGWPSHNQRFIDDCLPLARKEAFTAVFTPFGSVAVDFNEEVVDSWNLWKRLVAIQMLGFVRQVKHAEWLCNGMSTLRIEKEKWNNEIEGHRCS